MPWNDIRCNQPYILFIIYQDRAIRCNLTTDYNYILYCRKIEENLSSGEEQWRLQQNTCTRKYLCTSGKNKCEHAPLRRKLVYWRTTLTNQNNTHVDEDAFVQLENTCTQQEKHYVHECIVESHIYSLFFLFALGRKCNIGV